MFKKSLLGITLTILLLSTGIIFLSTYLGRLLYPFYYKEEISAIARQYNFEPCFVAALIHVESKFNPKAVSKRGACGLMQIMPATAEWIAEKQGWESLDLDKIFQLDTNLMLGVWYLHNLVEEFNDLVPVVAAYNAGRGNVNKWLQEGIWDGTLDTIDRIPFSETRQYVQKVWKTYRRYLILYKSGDKISNFIAGIKRIGLNILDECLLPKNTL